MSGNLNHYLAEMDRLLGLDCKYKRPGSTMDMNDFVYLYILAVYSLLMLKELGVRVDTQLELPRLMAEKAQPRYLYDMEYCEEYDEEESYNYYTAQWAGRYEPYTGCLSKKMHSGNCLTLCTGIFWT